MDSRTRLPPLAALAIVVALLFVMPSALNLPQTNPTTTLEYAPVPPDDETVDAPPGNLSSLGLPTGTNLQQDAATPPPPPAGDLGLGRNPLTKRCVGNPPRQTEDLMSPPCVGFFEGDNHGATYAGVTRDEITVMVVTNAGLGGRGTSSRGVESSDPNSYFDLSEPPKGNEHVFVRMTRIAQRYFNERFQTYDRRVRFVVHFGRGSTPEERRADAAEEYTRYKPFATISFLSGSVDAYVQAMSRRNVVVFLGFPTFPSLGQPVSYFRANAGKVWSYLPSTDQRAASFVDFVCKKVVGRHATFSGNPGQNGKPRKLAMVRMPDSATGLSDYLYMADHVRSGVEKCGGRIEDEVMLTSAYNPDPTGASRLGAGPQAAQMSRLQRKGITTLIWPGGIDSTTAHGMNQINYRPEIVMAGDNLNDNNNDAGTQPASVWRNVRLVSYYPRVDNRESEPCYRAANETDPSAPSIDIRHYFCTMYNDFRMLFTGIQVAGPQLTPETMDEGFHAIPPLPSNDPRRPSCFFEPGDYTCVKDAMVQWWDPSGASPEAGRQSVKGCFRAMENGRRYKTGEWPREDVEARRRPDDPCNAQGLTAT